MSESEMWDVRVVSDNGGWVYDLREAADGIYWMTDYGTTLHATIDCGHLYASWNAIHDNTRTLAYRVKRGDKIIGPNGKQISGLCWDCICINAHKVPKIVVRRKPTMALVAM